MSTKRLAGGEWPSQWRVQSAHLRAPWTSGRSNQSTLKEISPECSLEGLMLKLQSFGPLMQRTDSLEKTLMLGKIEGGRRRGRQWRLVGWHHWLNGHEFQQALGVADGQGGLACCSPWGHEESDTTERLNNDNGQHRPQREHRPRPPLGGHNQTAPGATGCLGSEQAGTSPVTAPSSPDTSSTPLRPGMSQNPECFSGENTYLPHVCCHDPPWGSKINTSNPNTSVFPNQKYDKNKEVSSKFSTGCMV